MATKKKVVTLITGASSGMGKVTAELFLKEGYIVYGVARRVEKMKDIESKGAKIIAMDVTDEKSIENAVNQIIQEQGRIDVLFNNAGYGLLGAAEDVSIEEAKRQFEVNLFGLGRLTQIVLPHMRKQKSGLIINNSSAGGKISTPLGAWYCASKHALEGYSDCLRLEVKQFGIGVVIIEPGSIKSEWGEIAYSHARETSGNTAYSRMTKAFIEMNKKMGEGESPELVANIALKAIKSRKSKTRYVVGMQGKMIVFMRKILSDKMFDRMIYSMLKM